jgi:short-subunit dehydrogenase
LTVVPGPIATEFGEVSGMKLKGMPVDRCVNSILKGMRKNKAVIVPGFTMKILRFLLRFVPRKWLLSISYRIQKKK